VLREVRFYPPEGRVLKTYGVDGLPNVNGTTGVIESIPAFLSNIDWANNGVLITITKSKGENLCIGVSPVGESASNTNYTPEFHHRLGGSPSETAGYIGGSSSDLRVVFDFDENRISIPVNLYMSRHCRFGADVFDGHANVVVLSADNVNVPAGSSNFYSFAGLQAGDVGNIGTPNIISSSQNQQSESH
jgi:hypothetical protein